MKVNIPKLLTIFDKILTDLTNEELGIYWLKSTRSDGLRITLVFSIYERYVGVSVTNKLNIIFADIDMKKCSEIRILDEKNKRLEIIHDDKPGRCFLQLTGERILIYTEDSSI